MADSNYYRTLEVSTTATQAEIKQAYRRLVKLFHPDSHRETADHEQITRINAAYEVLGDPQKRQAYDQGWSDRFHSDDIAKRSDRQQRAAEVQQRYQQQWQSGQEADEHLQKWLNQVYTPVNRALCRILNSLATEIEQLSADPFDDELMEGFQTYLENCHSYLKQAQNSFRSMPNPSNVAGVAAHLYHCLSQVSDGIEELEFFTLNYDDHYLHTGQELFRIANRLRKEAQAQLKSISVAWESKKASH